MRGISLTALLLAALGLCTLGCSGGGDDSSARTLEEVPLESGVFTQHMDPDIRPQDNFYRHMNGHWLDTAEIPADRTSDGAFYELAEKSRHDVRAIIEELSDRKNLQPGGDEQKVADLYRSMTDTSRINSQGLDPLRPYLAQIDAVADRSALSAWFARGQRLGAGAPFILYVGIDDKDATRYIPNLYQSGLGLPERDYYFNMDRNFEEIRIAYVGHIEKMMRLAGVPNPARTARDLLALERRIAELHWTNVENRDSEKTYNLMPIAEQVRTPGGLDWPAYWQAAGVAARYDVNVAQPSYLEGFSRLVADVDLETWRAYLKWNLLNSFAGYLSREFDQQNFDFYQRTLNGQQEPRPRWKRGVAAVNRMLGEVVGKVYVSRHFTPEAKVRMIRLVENLRAAYGASIDELDWLSPATKAEARRKLAAFTPKIGYPDRWRDYSALEIRPEDLVGNVMRTREFNHQDQLARLDEPIRDWEWGLTPQTVNAYYSPSRNEVVFPAAILQPPFFNLGADDAVNYGGIGAVIGHEMGHGFDDQGSQYDAEGNLKNWWTETDRTEFQLRTRGLVDQYGAYEPIEGLPINGELTLGENIGDLSGLTIAHKAYRMALAGQEPPVIDGLTGEQRFFMGYAQIWRGKYTEAELRNRIATDVHSPTEYRALGSLANFTPFYEAFGVKEGDGMWRDPADRVKLW